MWTRLTDEKGLPFEGAADRDGGGVNLVGVSAQSECEVDTENHEDREGDDLGDETGDHDVDARLSGARVVVGGGGDAAAPALENEREEVARDEDEGVCPRLDS